MEAGWEDGKNHICGVAYIRRCGSPVGANLRGLWEPCVFGEAEESGDEEEMDAQMRDMESGHRCSCQAPPTFPKSLGYRTWELNMSG